MAEHLDPDEVTMRVDRRDLECSICLEALQRPRSLPCLHTFCEDCLSHYIIQNVSSTTSFSCPVCRKEVTSVNPSVDRKLWAKDFPLNSLLDEMGQRSSSGQQHKIKMQDQAVGKRSFFCDPCKKKGSNVAAAYWCNMMSSAFCEDCKANYHDLIHDGCHLKMADSDMLTETPFQTCDRHNIIMDFFCEDHKSLYCSKCVALMHRRCISVKPAQDYCHTLRTGPTLTNLKDSLQKALRAMNTIVDGSNHQMQDLDLGKKTALDEVRSLRSDIDLHLNNLQTTMEQEIGQVHQEEHSKLKECLRSNTSVRNDLNDLNDAFESKQIMEDDMHTILLYQQGTSAVEHCCQMVGKARRAWQGRTVKHTVDFDRSKLDTRFSLGKITTPTTTRTLAINDDLELIFSHLRVAGESNFKIQLSWEINCCATGVLYMSDGRLVVADRNNKNLKLFTEDGTYVHHLNFHHAPWGICHHSGNQVATSMADGNFIAVVEVGSHTLKLLYEVDPQIGGSVYGISYIGGTYYLTSEGSTTIPEDIRRKHQYIECKYSMYSVKSDASVDSMMLLKNSSLYMVYDCRRKDIILSSTSKDSCSMAVCRSSPQKQVQDLAMADILKGTHGIDIDRDGNIYACGNASHNIVQMSATGEKVRELLTAAEGVRYPLDISVLDNRFAVTFDSWDRRNHVYIYNMGI